MSAIGQKTRYFVQIEEIHARAKAYHAERGTLAGAPHGTTRGHYEKYRDMCKASHLAITNLSSLGLSGAQDLTERYLCDKALNTIPLRRFDSLHAAYRICNQRLPSGVARTAAEYTCCIKHLLIYEVLKLAPEFTD